MANQLALRSHTQPGDEILIEANAHIYYYEGGAPAALSGVMCRCLNGQRGIFTGADVEVCAPPRRTRISPQPGWCALKTRTTAAEARSGPSSRREVAATARKHGLQLHLDGARLWNAAVASGIPERDYAAPFDTVSVCFSKGLGAPVGSALVGSKDVHRPRPAFPQNVRRWHASSRHHRRRRAVCAATPA